MTSSFTLNPKILQQLDSKRQQVQMTVTETNQEWQVLHLRVHTFAACAVVNLQQLPEKLNPVIKPLMEAIRKEENTLVQNYVASCIAKLLQQCTTRSPCPNSKIIKNLCNSLCVDPHLTPLAACPAQPQSGNENSKGMLCKTSRILKISVLISELWKMSIWVNLAFRMLKCQKQDLLFISNYFIQVSCSSTQCID